MPRDFTFLDAGILSPILRGLNATGAAAARLGWLRPNLHAKSLMDEA